MDGLPAELVARLDAELPNTESLQIQVLSMSPDYLSLGFEPYSTVPIASVCLIDANDMMQEARYAALQATAHLQFGRDPIWWTD